jgi:hypothetical protein
MYSASAIPSARAPPDGTAVSAMNLTEMAMPVLDPSSPGNSAHPLRRGKLAALAALTTLALLGGTGCVAEVYTRTVTPAPATVTYQEFAVVEEPIVHIAAAPVHVETYPRGTYVYYVDGRWYCPAHHGWVDSTSGPRREV